MIGILWENTLTTELRLGFTLLVRPLNKRVLVDIIPRIELSLRGCKLQFKTPLWVLWVKKIKHTQKEISLCHKSRTFHGLKSRTLIDNTGRGWYGDHILRIFRQFFKIPQTKGLFSFIQLLSELMKRMIGTFFCWLDL